MRFRVEDPGFFWTKVASSVHSGLTSGRVPAPQIEQTPYFEKTPISESRPWAIAQTHLGAFKNAGPKKSILNSHHPDDSGPF